MNALGILGGFGSSSYTPGRRYDPASRSSSRRQRLAARRSRNGTNRARSNSTRRRRSASPGVVELWEDLDRRLSEANPPSRPPEASPVIEPSLLDVTPPASPQHTKGRPPTVPRPLQGSVIYLERVGSSASSVDDPEVIELDDSASIGAFGEKDETVVEYAKRLSSNRSGPPMTRPEPNDLIDVDRPPSPAAATQQSGGFTDLLARNWQSATGWVWQAPAAEAPAAGEMGEPGGESANIELEEAPSVAEQSSSHHGLDIGAGKALSSLGSPSNRGRSGHDGGVAPVVSPVRDDFLASMEVLPAPSMDVKEPYEETRNADGNGEKGEGILGGLMGWWAPREGEGEPNSKPAEDGAQAGPENGEIVSNGAAGHRTGVQKITAARASPDGSILRGSESDDVLQGYSDSEVFSLSSNSSGGGAVDLRTPIGEGVGGVAGMESRREAAAVRNQSIDLLGLEDTPLPRGWLAEVQSGFRMDALAEAMDGSDLPKATVAEMSREILAHAYGLPPRVSVPAEPRVGSIEGTPQEPTPIERVTSSNRAGHHAKGRRNSPPLPSSTALVRIGGTAVPGPGKAQANTYISPASQQKPADLAAARRVHALVHRGDRPKLPPSGEAKLPTRLETIMEECKTMFQRHCQKQPAERSILATVWEAPEMSRLGTSVLEDSPEGEVEKEAQPLTLSPSPPRTNHDPQGVYCEIDQKTVADLRSPLGQFHSDLLQEALRAKAALQRPERSYPIDDRVLADLARAARKRFHLSRTMAGILSKSETGARAEAKGKTTIDPKPAAERSVPTYCLPESSSSRPLRRDPFEKAQPVEPRVLECEEPPIPRSLSVLPTPSRCEPKKEHALAEPSVCPSRADSDSEGISSVSSRTAAATRKCSKCGSSGIDMTGRRLSRVVQEQMRRWSWCAECTFERFPSISAAPKRSSFVSQRVFLGRNTEEWLWELSMESNLPVEYPDGSGVLWPTGRHLTVALLFGDAETKRAIRAAPTLTDVEAVCKERRQGLREDYMDLREGAVQLVADLMLKQHTLLKVVLKSIPNFVVELRQRDGDNDELLGGIVADVWNESTTTKTAYRRHAVRREELPAAYTHYDPRDDICVFGPSTVTLQGDTTPYRILDLELEHYYLRFKVECKVPKAAYEAALVEDPDVAISLVCGIAVHCSGEAGPLPGPETPLHQSSLRHGDDSSDSNVCTPVTADKRSSGELSCPEGWAGPLESWPGSTCWLWVERTFRGGSGLSERYYVGGDAVLSRPPKTGLLTRAAGQQQQPHYTEEDVVLMSETWEIVVRGDVCEWSVDDGEGHARWTSPFVLRRLTVAPHEHTNLSKLSYCRLERDVGLIPLEPEAPSP
ncbi:hypothetical protein FOZ61_006808 [Perkinsus olseni]|uniref:Uncharacterized protein n=1 Tax=Perkinsus olseni TaxID=32597 RepID=A0A7J6MWQ9_PEROL|nr:hypothetical protein FOZ61_006808 [Perkinsus olseni]KAF4676052.1 hypothetical protein FOL46_007930 [Perkinsus olseni]